MQVQLSSAFRRWPTFVAFPAFGSFRKIAPFVSEGKQRRFRSILRFQPTGRAPPPHRLGLKVEGHSQRLFAEARFHMWTDS